jgi:hypothetical protein
MSREEAHEEEAESPFQSFTDAITALLFIFMVTTFAVMISLRRAEQQQRHEVDRLQGADVASGKLLSGVAACMGQVSGLKPVIDEGAHTLAMYIEVDESVVEWFGVCSPSISPSAGAVVDQVRGCLAREVPALTADYSVALTLEGHTDARQPSGACAQSYPSNWELSGARAGAVLRRLMCEDGRCATDQARTQAAELAALASQREDLQVIAAGRASSIPAWRALCDPGWPGARIDQRLDGAVCGRLPQATSGDAAVQQEVVSVVKEALDPDGGRGEMSFDRALTLWANIPACGGGGEACEQRLGRLRRVDLRVNLQPKLLARR